MIRSFLLLLSIATACVAFAPISSNNNARVSSSPLFMGAPRFDKSTQRWYPTSEEEGAASGYDAVGSLIRQGPVAYLKRISNPDEYEQACLKFMAQDGCTYQQAQGNMDRMNENAQDWLYERMEADRKGIKIDYVTVNPKAVSLRLVWASIVFALGGRAIYSAVTGEPFNDIFR